MLSQRAGRVKPSATLAVDSKAKSMKAKGIDVINFGVGEPDFDTPEYVKEAAIKAIKDGFTKYTPVGGTDELKSAIIEKFSRDNNLNYKLENIIVSCGAKHSLYNISQALLSPGDEVIIPSPYWVSYPDQTLLNDGVPVFVDTFEEDDFMVNPDAIQSAITKKTKALILNYPSNPTGFTYSKEVLEKIGELALRHDFYIISDEVYEYFIYDDTRHISIASLNEEIKSKTIVVNALSKSHAMTGWRIGYAAGPTDIIKAMTSIQSQSTSNPTSIAQKAAVAALKGSHDFTNTMVKEFDKRRKILVEGINAIDGISCKMPKGAFYTFPNVSGIYGKRYGDKQIKSSFDLAMYLLDEANVAMVHGEAFGNDNHVRLSYAISSQDIMKALERIKSAIGNLS
ncbi:MAG: pyridoxal phosphate-dependent aminotransferase [Thermodesulfovibrionales bacterium]|nr:pyridoxal phosphate-dependent aminotransferase [Thermodesulfovibrionales bacterium]